jgi:hypothetical protein
LYSRYPKEGFYGSVLYWGLRILVVKDLPNGTLTERETPMETFGKLKQGNATSAQHQSAIYN